MSPNLRFNRTHFSRLISFALVGVSLTAMTATATTLTGTDQNALFGVDDDLRNFLSANRGSNGGGDQSLQAGDALSGTCLLYTSDAADE